LIGPLHLRRSKLPRCPLASDTPHDAVAVDVGAARAETGRGTLYTSVNAD